MKKSYLTKMIIALMLGFFGLTHANAQFLDNPATVNVVQIGSFDDGETRRYLADISGVVTFSLDQNTNSQWYAIPCGSVSNGTTDVQAYYYKNLATGNYLCIDDATLAQLDNLRAANGDWPVALAKAVADNAGTLGFKWFYRPANDWGWAMWFSNAANIDLTARPGNDIYTLMSISMMNHAGSEFFGVNYPDVAVGGFAGGYPGNAWSAVTTPSVVATVPNPELPPVVEGQCLDLNNLTLIGDGASYDSGSKTITYTGAWQYAGWQWAGRDVSMYDYVEVTFDTGGLPAGTNVELCVSYLGGNGDGDYIINPEVKAGMQTIKIPLGVGNRGTAVGNAPDKSTLWRIGTKNSSGAGGTVVLQSACFGTNPVFPPGCLDISTLTIGGDKAHYDAGTGLTTITYTGSWQYTGWEWPGGTDFSAYNYLDITMDVSGVTVGGPGDIEVCVSYAGGYSGDGDYIVHPSTMNGMQTIRIPIGIGNRGDNGSGGATFVPNWTADATKVWRIGTKNAGGGTILLQSACFGYEAPLPPLTYSLDRLNFFASDDGPNPAASSYDPATKVATYNDQWRRVGWDFSADGGLDVSSLGNEVVLEFDASALPAEGDGSPSKVQFDVTYMDGTKESVAVGGFGGGFANGNEYRSTDTKAYWVLSDNTKKIALITLKSEYAGTILLTNAYIDTYTPPVINPVDLTVTNVTWSPLNPKTGDAVTFSATIKNNSSYDSPSGKKHGVVFYVNGAIVNWGDQFMGPIPAGGQVVVTATGGPSGSATWACESDASYTITALVNDDKGINETDYTNNTSADYTLNNAAIVEPTTIDYTLADVNFFGNDDGYNPSVSSYDASTNTATYLAAWTRVGWDFTAQGGLYPTGNQIVIEFDASQLPAEGDGSAAKVQFDVWYMDGTQESVAVGGTGGGFANGNEYRSTDTKAYWTLSDPTKAIKLITLKSEFPGTIVFTNAYFTNVTIGPTGDVDLIVTSVRWTPLNPKPGDAVTFYATIKNNSNVDSPSNVKHGVVFQYNGQTATWCDGFRGPIPAGGEVEVSATMPGSTGSTWKCGNDPTYDITAWVNDTKDVTESDYANNYSDVNVMVVDGQVDLVVSDVTWSPAKPAVNDHVVFSLTVQNLGTVNAIAGVNKNVKFIVNGDTVTWNDYTAAINVGAAPVKITANAGLLGSVSKFNYWVATGGLFTVKGEVNGNKSIVESNYTNNSIEKTLTIGTGIEDVQANTGKVYAKDGKLYFVNYPAASVAIYSVSGQKIASYEKISDGTNISLVSGIYVVSVQYGGKVYNHKVIVK